MKCQKALRWARAVIAGSDTSLPVTPLLEHIEHCSDCSTSIAILWAHNKMLEKASTDVEPEHISEFSLVRYDSGQADNESIRLHIAECSSCADRLKKISKAKEVLVKEFQLDPERSLSDLRRG